MPASKQCYQCGNDNPEQAFCGACGSPLALNEYIATKVKDQLTDTIRNRDVLEMDSSIKVFKQAWSWIRLIIGIAVGLLVLVGGGVFWKASDFWSGVDKAKQSVTDTAKKSTDDITRVSSQSKQDISKALDDGKVAITTASNDAARQTQVLKDATVQSKADISRETKTFRNDLENSRQQLQAASEIQPEMESMRKQLGQAIIDIQAQQKVISSSGEFVKSVFSSHAVQFFQIGQPPTDRYKVIAPPPGGNRTVVLLLLPSVPIFATVQIQYHVFTQPPNSYFTIKNLIVFFWGDPPDNLAKQQLSVSYFPDLTDKDIIHTLSEHDARVFADDQPLPKFNQPDPDFKGNKWMPISPTPAKP
jgi:hypothetical protein